MHGNLPAQRFNRRTMVRLLAAGSLIPVALARRADAQQSAGSPSGTVTMEQTQVSLLGPRDARLPRSHLPIPAA